MSSNFLQPFRAMFPGMSNLGSSIAMDISRTDDGYNVEIPVPGFRPDDIEVSFENDTLMVSGKTERRSFTRVLELPDDVDPDNISGHVENGLLCLHLNRRAEARRRRIEVTAGEGDHDQTSRTVPTMRGETDEREQQREAAETR